MAVWRWSKGRVLLEAPSNLAKNDGITCVGGNIGEFIPGEMSLGRK